MHNQDVSTTNIEQRCKISGRIRKNSLEQYLDKEGIFKLPGRNEILSINVAKVALEYFQRWDFRRVEKGKCKEDENKVKRQLRNYLYFTSLWGIIKHYL